MITAGRLAGLAIALPVLGFAAVAAATVAASASDTAAKQGAFDYQIRVHYEGPKGFLTLHDRTGREVVRYPVALPYYMPKYLPAVGRIAGTIRKPVWYPTKTICRATGACKPVKPGPANPLGVGFFVLRFKGPGDNLIGIHGTNAPWAIGRRVSFGCIRMHNKDWLALERRVRGKRVSVKLARFPKDWRKGILKRATGDR